MPDTLPELLIANVEALSRQLRQLRGVYRFCRYNTKGPASQYVRLAGLSVRAALAQLLCVLRKGGYQLPTGLDTVCYELYDQAPPRRSGGSQREPGRGS